MPGTSRTVLALRAFETPQIKVSLVDGSYVDKFFLNADEIITDYGSFLEFALRTRSEDKDRYPFLVKGRHPDLKAGRFVTSVWQGLNSLFPNRFRGIRANWCPYDELTDNYHTFCQLYAPGMDPRDVLAAASMTWTGSKLESMGLSASAYEIDRDQYTGEIERILVYFTL